MAQTQKKEIVDNILNLLVQLTADEDSPATAPTTKPVEMLTIKECTEVIQEISEHTIRQLVTQGKVKFIRTGQGRRGKILVNKADLVAYFNGKAV